MKLKEFGYSIQEKDLKQYNILIDKFIPDFEDPFLDESVYINKYLSSLGKFDLNLLIFLKNQPKNPKAITLTPVLNNSKCNAGSNLTRK